MQKSGLVKSSFVAAWLVASGWMFAAPAPIQRGPLKHGAQPPAVAQKQVRSKPAPPKATPAKAKAAPAAPSPKAVPQKGLSLLNAAAAVLERSDAPMAVKGMIEEAKAQGLWTPRGGKTPEQTLYSAIIREIRDKGSESRFRKDGRGLFAFAK